MSMPIGGERPTTVGVGYSVALVPESTMRPRIMDSRIGVNYSVRLGIPKEGEGTKRIFYSHRWNLVPKDKKAYAKGKLTQPANQSISIWMIPSQRHGNSQFVRVFLSGIKLLKDRL